MTSKTRSGNSRRLPASPAVRRYLFGFFLTNVGVGGFTLATGLILFARTGSAELFAVLVGMEFGLGLIGQVIGVSVLDRIDALRVATSVNTIRGCAILICGATLFVTHGAIALMGVFVLSAIIRPLYRAASFALVVHVCEPVELIRVNGLRFGLLQLAQITGLLCVSVLNAFAPAPAMLLGVAAFLLWGTAILAGLRCLPSRFVPECQNQLVGRWLELRGALRSTPSVGVHLLLACAGPLALAIAAVLVAPINAECGGGAWGIVVLDGAAAVGAFVAVLISRRFALPQLALLIWIAPPLMATGLLLLGLSQGIGPAVAAFFALGCGSVLSATALDSLLQHRTSPRLIGRIAITKEAAISGVGLVALPVFGDMVTRSGIDFTSVVFAAVLACFTLAFAVGWSIHGDRLLTRPIGEPR